MVEQKKPVPMDPVSILEADGWTKIPSPDGCRMMLIPPVRSEEELRREAFWELVSEEHNYRKDNPYTPEEREEMQRRQDEIDLQRMLRQDAELQQSLDRALRSVITDFGEDTAEKIKAPTRKRRNKRSRSWPPSFIDLYDDKIQRQDE